MRSVLLTVSVVLLIRSGFFVLGQNDIQPGNNRFNKSVAWGQFFPKFPDMWNGVTNAIKQASVSDMNFYQRQTLNIFRSGFTDLRGDLSESTPFYGTYQWEVRKALLYLGLPGTTGPAVEDAVKGIVQYPLQQPFALFQNNGVSEQDGAAWPVGPNVCLSRKTSFVDAASVNPIKNVTYCTSSRDDAMMKVVCWLPKLANNDEGPAISGTNYTTVYSCCPGFELPALPTAFPPARFDNVLDVLMFLDRPTSRDDRVCQEMQKSF